MARVLRGAPASTSPPPPFPRMTYAEAMAALRHRPARPALRARDRTTSATRCAGTEFKVFAGVLGGRRRRARRSTPARASCRARDLDELTELGQAPRRRRGSSGRSSRRTAAGARRSRSSSPRSERRGDRERLGAQAGRPAAVVADSATIAAHGARRAARWSWRGASSSMPEGAHDLLWVVDFPLFEWNEDEQRWDALHHPFTAPPGDLDAIPATLRSRAYDLVLNGTELGGGSIRIHRPDVQQQRASSCSASTPRRPQARFGFLLDALQLRRAAARRHRARARPHRHAARRPRLDPRRDRVPEDRQRRRPADRRAGAGGRGAAARAGAAVGAASLAFWRLLYAGAAWRLPVEPLVDWGWGTWCREGLGGLAGKATRPRLHSSARAPAGSAFGGGQHGRTASA